MVKRELSWEIPRERPVSSVWLAAAVRVGPIFIELYTTAMPGLLTRLAPRKPLEDKTRGYAVAVLATAFAAALRLSLIPVLGTADPWILFVVAAGCAGWAGGGGPAMLAGALSVAVVTTTLLGPPPAAYTGELTYLRVFAFLFVSALVSVARAWISISRLRLRVNWHPASFGC
jgi:hypothetical protein